MSWGSWMLLVCLLGFCEKWQIMNASAGTFKTTKLSSTNTKVLTFHALSAPSHLISYKSKINQLLKGPLCEHCRRFLFYKILHHNVTVRSDGQSQSCSPSLSACCCSTADFIVFKETIGKGLLKKRPFERFVCLTLLHNEDILLFKLSFDTRC